ncbi:HU family DNA-binding protein [Sulfitobacter guttiformis]|uniref:DNA-binding protein HU-alpha n=1 Tax=Sulfitobacter guttiformis TaxID=74349 RepID=A0A420DII2_9RHOB|nr:HU family DNA-binding protein [Sulfitobacter guttiformis]KIN72199.1 DNA-binding protein HU [Sulfitobacter guttiformis KCTC 32187]RKE94029.1 DNA-binding protein HU-alpha [Sulfitobacter guttiformis]
MSTSSKTPPKTGTLKTTVAAPVAEVMTKVDTTGVPSAAATTPSVVEKLSPVVVSEELKKKELFDLVVARSGMKKKDVKPVVEAMLGVLGDVLAEQRELNLQPLGKLKVQRAKELPDGRALVLKLRQKSAQMNAAAAAPVAPPKPVKQPAKKPV